MELIEPTGNNSGGLRCFCSDSFLVGCKAGKQGMNGEIRELGTYRWIDNPILVRLQYSPRLIKRAQRKK